MRVVRWEQMPVILAMMIILTTTSNAGVGVAMQERQLSVQATPTAPDSTIPMVGVDAQGSNYHPGPAPVGELSVADTWLPDMIISMPPLVTSRMVIVVPFSPGKTSTVHAFDRESGEELWELRDPEVWTNVAPAIAGDQLFFVTNVSEPENPSGPKDSLGPFQVVAVDLETGEAVVWPTLIDAQPSGRLVVDGGSLFFTDEIGVAVFETSTGDLRWRHDFEDEASMASSPLLSGNSVFTTWRSETQSETYLLSIDVSTGKTNWQRETKGTADLIAGDAIVVTRGNTIAGHSVQSGEQLWQMKSPIPEASWLATDGASLVVAEDIAVAKIDLATRETVWSKPLGFGLDPADDNIAITDTTIVLLRQAKATMLDQETGEVLLDLTAEDRDGRRVNIDEVAIIDNLIYASTAGGLVVYQGTGDPNTLPVSPLTTTGFTSPDNGYRLEWDAEHWQAEMLSCGPADSGVMNDFGDTLVLIGASGAGNGGLGLIYIRHRSDFSTDDPLGQIAAGPLVGLFVEYDPDSIQRLEDPTVSLVLPDGAEIAQIGFDEAEGELPKTEGIIVMIEPEGRDGVLLLIEVYAESSQLPDVVPFIQELVSGVGPAPEGELPSCP